MKKISAAFDGLKFSKGTMEYAIRVAAESKALLSGVFLDSFLYHSFGLYDMVGKKGVSEVKLKHLLDKDEEARLKAATAFTKTCKKAGVTSTVHHDENFAIPDLVRESIYSDLLLISPDETFSHLAEDRPTRAITDLLEHVQCPVMIVPQEYKPIEKVVLLYDGKPSSVFAIKMFNYMMAWMQGTETEIISVTDPADEQELPDGKLIREFIECHYPASTYTLLKGNAEEEIVTYLKTLSPNILIVLGAYRRGTVSRWFKTSMADILMKEINVPMFIAHNK